MLTKILTNKLFSFRFTSCPATLKSEQIEGGQEATPRWKFFFIYLFFRFLSTVSIIAQTNPRFNVNLSFDYSSADQTISLLDGKQINTTLPAKLHGNRIATSISGFIGNSKSMIFLLLSSFDNPEIFLKTSVII